MNKRQWFSFLKVLAPVVLGAASPKLASVSNVVVHAIEEAELLDAPGPEKLAHVQGIVSDALDAVNTMKGHEVANPGEVNAVIAHGVETLVKVTNLVHRSQSQVTEVKK